MIAVHPTTPSNIPALVEYLTHLGPETRSRFAPHAYDEATLHKLLIDESRHIAFIAREENGGPIVGYAVVRLYHEEYEKERFRKYGWGPDEAIDAFYAPSVADDRQGKGIGTLLLNETKRSLQAMGKTRILLWGGVQAGNERALNHYRKAGFRELGGFEWNGWNLDMVLDIP